MECPECGFDVDGSANFCPMCRHRFQESLVDDPLPAGEQEQAAETTAEPLPDEELEKFSGKELQYLKVQLIQPSMIMVAAVALTGYLSVPQVQILSFTFRDSSFPVGGAVCLLAGIVVGGLFYGIMAARLKRFRSI